MIDFETLTNKDEVMNYLEAGLEMTDEGYSVVKQDETAITNIINQAWAAEFESYLEWQWRNIRTNILEELVEQGYLKDDNLDYLKEDN